MSGAAVDKRALRDRVYDLVLDRLMRGAMEPGDRLSIDVLAREFDVSPTPVREALVQLERTGLVTRVALKGYRVAPPISGEQIDELFTARLVLESGATELAMQSSDGLQAALADAQQRHEEVAQRLRGDAAPDVSLLQEYFDADWGFHRVILDHAHNRFLLEMSDSVGTHLLRMRQSLATGHRDLDEAIAEHRSILAAVSRNDRAAAVTAMRAHIAAVRTRALHDA